MSNFKKLSLFSIFKSKNKNNKDRSKITTQKLNDQLINHANANNFENNSKINDKKTFTQVQNLDKLQYNNINKKNFFNKLKVQLSKTRKIINFGINYIFSKKKIDHSVFETIEELLLTSDVGIHTTTKIMQYLTKEVYCNNIQEINPIYLMLKKKMYKFLKTVEIPLQINTYNPFIILVVGVNGAGKTTTIGKLAMKYKEEGKSVMLAAGDTFRAGAIEQLCLWGKDTKVPVVTQHFGADPASVIFDTIQSAQSKKIDIVIADTSGRLQNKEPLMNELKKIVKVTKKLNATGPHEIMLVIDGSSGQNVIRQIKLFNKFLKITGIVITKLDGTAKGGILFAIADMFSIPIRYIGVGEKKHDLYNFSSTEFVDALFLNNHIK
ncbi:signal recognition particle receptor [Buchnera aphidicola (Nipponaphis monzeni)]|uniref:Signal recognition particle receptor FtsY n=1 Tax=Buchnera aphidicola (Nipponaphis monzeni) TaxID=2495405 RepID=A0A455T9N8_9GAMM|nr:signal recognition particle-docking protein FtsY [Buchnera aphidicola]BBI01041.1 signal recognition particle receptor [Buchnera aphidicola (Nipponaphis monzeni)]